jgi:hypothetical protein
MKKLARLAAVAVPSIIAVSAVTPALAHGTHVPTNRDPGTCTGHGASSPAAAVAQTLVTAQRHPTDYNAILACVSPDVRPFLHTEDPIPGIDVRFDITGARLVTPQHVKGHPSDSVVTLTSTPIAHLTIGSPWVSEPVRDSVPLFPLSGGNGSPRTATAHKVGGRWYVE